MCHASVPYIAGEQDFRPISRFVYVFSYSIHWYDMAFSPVSAWLMQVMFVLQEHSAGSHKRLLWGWFFLERPRTKMLFTKALSAIAFCPILFSDFTQDQQWPLLCILPAE